MQIQSAAEAEVEEDSGDEFGQQLEAALLAEISDEEMQDAGTKSNKTESELEAEAWVTFDAAVAEDLTAIPKPEPRVVEDNFKMPLSTKRARDFADWPADMSMGRAKFVINLDLSFDVSGKPKYLQSQNMHYYIYGQDATTIDNLFETLWLENHEWLIHEGYPLEYVQRVKRLEITLLIKEGQELMNTHRWTINGVSSSEEQSQAWNEFLEAAKRWGRGEALDQLSIIERYQRIKRLRCVEYDLGYLYDQSGQYWKPRKYSVHAQVDAEIVLHFD